MKFTVEGTPVDGSCGGVEDSVVLQIVVAVIFMVIAYFVCEFIHDWWQGVLFRLTQLVTICVAGYIGARLALFVFISTCCIIGSYLFYFFILRHLYNWICS